MRLTEPDSGEVLVEGQNILSLGRQSMREMRRTVQMIFQDPYASLNPRMTVGAAIAEPYIEHRLGSARDAKNVVADMLEKVGLTPDMAKRYPHEFSGGQRQRICIARALALKPKVIVADESVSALDVSIKAQVINLMLDLQESLDLAFLFISHDMAVVERVSHRVAVMYLGEIVEIGPRSSVFENPQHDYTRKLMAAVPIPDPDRRKTRLSSEGENSRALFGPRILSCLCVNIARFRRSTSWRCGARDLTSGLMIDPALPQLRQQQRTPMGGGVGLGGSYNWDGDKYSIYGKGSVNTSLAEFGDSYCYKGNIGFRVKW